MAIQPTNAEIGRDFAIEISAFTGGMLPSLKFWATDPNTTVETVVSTDTTVSVTRGDKKLVIRLPNGGAAPQEIKDAIIADPDATALFFRIDAGDPTVTINSASTITCDTEEKERLTARNVTTNPEGEPVDTTNLNSGNFMESAEESGVHQLKFTTSECILVKHGFTSDMLFHAKAYRLHVSLFVVSGSSSVRRTEFTGRFDVSEFSVSHNYDQTGAYNLTVGSSGPYKRESIANAA